MNPLIWDDSPVTEVLTKVLEAMLPQSVVGRQTKENKDFVIWSYREDFSRLWSLDGRDARSIVGWALNGGDEALRTLVLVWDGMPSQKGTINVADFVLPFDWAFALSTTVIKECRAHEAGGVNGKLELPNLRVLILDLSSEKHVEAFSSNSLPAFGHAMPWIQMYRPIQSDRLELAALFSGSNDHYAISLLRTAITAGALGVKALLEDVRNPDRLLSLREAFIERDRSKDIEALTSLYKSSMLGARTRHDVGNLLAPLLLVEALPQNQRRPVKKALMEKYPLRTALKNLASIIGLDGNASGLPSTSSNIGIIQKLQDAGDVFERRNNVSFLLIDDQFSLGYQHLLASVLFGEQYHPGIGSGTTDKWRVQIAELGELNCHSSADQLLTILEGLRVVEDWNAPRLLQTHYHILILDLRLWTNQANRGRFFERVLKLCEALLAENIDDLRFKNALRRAKAIVSDRDLDQSELEALALFPLLISHIDPSLPIILFSSTQQRAVLDLVSHRPSIITGFAKPIFSGYGEEENLSGPLANLEDAITKGIYQHESRKIWEEIVKRADWVRSSSRERRFKGVRIKGTDKKLSTVYSISKSSIKGLAQEFCEYILTARFADSLLAIGNWSEHLLGGRLEKMPQPIVEFRATRKALEIEQATQGTTNYDQLFQRVWHLPVYREAIDEMLRGIAKGIEPQKKKEAMFVVLNRKDEPQLDPDLNVSGLGLKQPHSRSPARILGLFLDSDKKVRSLLPISTDWLKCLDKDVASAIVSVTNGFRNARAHRRVTPADSAELRNFAIWCWLWTLSGFFPADGAQLISIGDGVDRAKGLEATDFIRLKRPFIKSSGPMQLNGVASILSILTSLADVLRDGWLKVNDPILELALDRLLNSSSGLRKRDLLLGDYST